MVGHPRVRARTSSERASTVGERSLAQAQWTSTRSGRSDSNSHTCREIGARSDTSAGLPHRSARGRACLESKKVVVARDKAIDESVRRESLVLLRRERQARANGRVASSIGAGRAHGV